MRDLKKREGWNIFLLELVEVNAIYIQNAVDWSVNTAEEIGGILSSGFTRSISEESEDRS